MDIVVGALVEDEAAAGDEWGEEVFLGEIEAGRGNDERVVLRGEGEGVDVPVEEIGEALVEDGCGFGGACGAGGEDGVDG